MSLTLPEELLRKHLTAMFVETGTYNGGGVALALKVGFQRIHSIEVDPDKAFRAIETFTCFPFITIHKGDTLDVLPRILTDFHNLPAVLWLDAHPIDKGQLGKVACPIIQELELLARMPRRDYTILIDDRWLFKDHFGTTDTEVVARLAEINKDYKISYADSTQRKGDIVVAEV